MSLILIAKPGDELLYFAPTLLSVPNIKILCLTSGSWDGKEWNEQLGQQNVEKMQLIKRSLDLQFFIIEHPRIKFCPHMSFDIELAVNFLRVFVREHRITEIFTYNGNSLTLELTRRNTALIAQRIGVRTFWLKTEFKTDFSFKNKKADRLKILKLVKETYGKYYKKRQRLMWQKYVNYYVSS